MSPAQACERLAPFGEVQVAGDHTGGALVALGDQIVEALVLPGLEGLEPEVVDDKQRHPAEGPHLALDGAGDTSGVDLREQAGLRGEHHILAPSDRAVTDGLGDMALNTCAPPRRPNGCEFRWLSGCGEKSGLATRTGA
jgi:hypothetical protein